MTRRFRCNWRSGVTTTGLGSRSWSAESDPIYKERNGCKEEATQQGPDRDGRVQAWPVAFRLEERPEGHLTAPGGRDRPFGAAQSGWKRAAAKAQAQAQLGLPNDTRGAN